MNTVQQPMFVQQVAPNPGSFNQHAQITQCVPVALLPGVVPIQLGSCEPPKDVAPLLMGKPTVFPADHFDPRRDAEDLRKAMKGMGTDEKAIIEVLTRRTNQQRLAIAEQYKTTCKRDLIADLKSETSGNFRTLLVTLVTPMAMFYAQELNRAFKRFSTDKKVLIEVMCSLPNREIAAVKEAYKSTYGKNLVDDIRRKTSGYFKRFMTAVCQGNRSEDFHVNATLAIEDAIKLLRAGVKRIGTDETAFITVLTTRSFPQLVAMFKEYRLVAGHDIDEAIRREFSGSLKKALRAMLKLVFTKAVFFADLLYKSMKGLGTNDRQLMRVMVTRAEVDLADVSEIFERKYGKSLVSWIKDDTSGDYKKCLLGLLGA